VRGAVKCKRKSEPLRDYIERFDREAVQVRDYIAKAQTSRKLFAQIAQGLSTSS
jgi:hypothetical protein